MTSALRKSDGDLPVGMTVDEFLGWVSERPGCFEWHGGQVVAMATERVRHAQVKYAVVRTLADAISKSVKDCYALPDGVGVKVSECKWYHPDALVYCGPLAPPDDISIPNPVIVVEVSSPSTATIDEQQKLIGYFSLPSVQHDLIVPPERPLVHFKRQADGSALANFVAAGSLHLDPPGIEIDVDSIFAD